jgi:hypothetical protein
MEKYIPLSTSYKAQVETLLLLSSDSPLFKQTIGHISQIVKESKEERIPLNKAWIVLEKELTESSKVLKARHQEIKTGVKKAQDERFDHSGDVLDQIESRQTEVVEYNWSFKVEGVTREHLLQILLILLEKGGLNYGVEKMMANICKAKQENIFKDIEGITVEKYVKS